MCSLRLISLSDEAKPATGSGKIGLARGDIAWYAGVKSNGAADVDTQERFGSLVRRYRRRAELTQEGLAERAGLSVRAVRDIERGSKHQPRPETIQLLLDALAVPEDERAVLEGAHVGPRNPASSLWGDPHPQAVTLPLQPTSFIGRVQELKEVESLLNREEVRLLTLTGTGGVGKTRLALRAAEDVADTYPDGVWFVSLAPLGDPGQVPAGIASTLAIKEMRGVPILDGVTAYLRSKTLLLVLDNFEHLLPASDAVSHLLATCARLTILVTSRTVLHLAAEHEYPVPPFRLPTSTCLSGTDAFAQYDAIQLFAQRARAVKPTFQLTEDNVSAVAGICHRLDGLPLAIELAASRIRLFPPPALLQRLSSRLSLLTGGASDLPTRLQTVRSAIDWSYHLLNDREQALFARLSVFAGGCTFEAAEAVCNVEGNLDMLEGLTSLVEKNLLRQEGAEEPRFTMLETLREYATEQLIQRGEQGSLLQRHAQYFTALAEEAEPKLNGSEQRVWLERLECDHDNLRAALAWCLEQTDQAQGEKGAQAAEVVLRLAASLHFFWLFHEHHREGLMWLEQVLTRAAPVRTRARAKALVNAGVLAGLAGNLGESEPFVRQSIALSRQIGDQERLSMALAVLGSSFSCGEEDEQAVAALEESLTLARAVGEPWLVAHALLHTVFRVVNSPAIGQAEERARARAAGAEALSLFEATGNRLAAAVMQLSLAQIALREGDYARARTALLACVPTLRTMGWRSTVADGLVGLADVAREQGEIEEAAALYEEGLALYRQVGDHLSPNIAWVHCRLANMYLDQGDWTGARAHAAETLTIARDDGQVEVSEIVHALQVYVALAAREVSSGSVRLANAVASLRSFYGLPEPAFESRVQERRVTYLPQSPRLPQDRENDTRSDHWSHATEHARSKDVQATAWTEEQPMSLEEVIAYALDEVGVLEIESRMPDAQRTHEFKLPASAPGTSFPA